MGQLLKFNENNINIVFEITEENKLWLLHLSNDDFDFASISGKEIQYLLEC